MVLAAVDLNEPAVEERRGLGLEKDETQPVGAGMKLARIVEPEIDAAQPRTLKPGDRGAIEFGMIDGGQARFARGGEEGVAIGNDAARDHDLAGDRSVHELNIGAGLLPLLAQLARSARGDDALRQPVAQIAVADFGQPLKMRDQPRAILGIGASASPTNDDCGHGRAPLLTMG